VLNALPGVLCDRAYFPGGDLTALLARHGKPLFGVESRQPLGAFDCLGFSLAYELGGTNILQMLHLSGVPLSWRERQEAPGVPWDVAAGSWPLVFAGGPTATSNPEPFADFFDYFALGDGEELLAEIAVCLQRCKSQGLDRDATLFQLATTVPGVYVPAYYEAPEGFGGAVFPSRPGVPERVLRRVATPDPFQQIGLVPFVATVHDRMTARHKSKLAVCIFPSLLAAALSSPLPPLPFSRLPDARTHLLSLYPPHSASPRPPQVEIRRGCTRGCRFCAPGMLTRPARDVEPERVVAAVADGLRKTGYSEFSLLSLSCSDYLSLPSVGLQIKNALRGENVSLSLPSQRVDRFDDNIANIISGGACPLCRASARSC
jgi:radical SAM superfamily enzyme YgiQ (UPF0313 family)